MINIQPDQDMEFNRQAAVRRVMDGEATPDEIAFVQNRIERSELWMRSSQRVEAMMNDARNLPEFTPPDRVWKKIRSTAHCTQPDSSLAGWFQFSFVGRRALRFAPAAMGLLLIVGFWFSQPGVQSVYEIVEVTDESRFGIEAEAYIAYHDLSNENASARDGLIAYYTYGLSE
ncbi:MAG: hypothetical protein P9L94_04465 [Candidatus Hinthialibacter antarcticus]|nr:hypothetical protein [Candidatus Hinthialibacter antarcticus]